MRRLAFFTLLGAATSLVIALACAVIVPMGAFTSTRAIRQGDRESAWWTAHAPNGAARIPTAVRVQRGLGASAWSLHADRTGHSAVVPGGVLGPILESPPTAILDRALIVEAGVPFVSLRGVRWDLAHAPSTTIPTVGDSIGSPVPAASREDWAVSMIRPGALGVHPQFRLLPLKPTFPGLAINTLVYGALFWLLARATRSLRASRQGRRAGTLGETHETASQDHDARGPRAG